MGSIDAARRAGARQATPATASNRTVTAARISGSRELSVTHREATVSKSKQRSTPATRPTPTFHDVPERTMVTTSRVLAPSAILMPNSFVLVATP